MQRTHIFLLTIFFIIVNLYIFRSSINKENYSQISFTTQASDDFQNYLIKYLKKCNNTYIIKYEETDSIKYAVFDDFNISVMDTYGDTRIGFLTLNSLDNSSQRWWAKESLPLELLIDSIGNKTIKTFFDQPSKIGAFLKFHTSDSFSCQTKIN